MSKETCACDRGAEAAGHSKARTVPADPGARTHLSARRRHKGAHLPRRRRFVADSLRLTKLNPVNQPATPNKPIN